MINPFKLISSYIGLLVGLVGAYFSFSFIFYLAETGNFHISALLIPFLIVISGFLLGWFLDRLVRRIF
ncbi:MAG: hypothetical protein ACP5D2_05170 [Candidatus Nanoarchaeia archaeon]